MNEAARSVNGVPIRLTYERWYHIVESHDELVGCFHDVLETVERPDLVVRGTGEPSRLQETWGGEDGWWWPTGNSQGATDS